jgi:thiol-disulfide isomerase/thioredoxin
MKHKYIAYFLFFVVFQCSIPVSSLWSEEEYRILIKTDIMAGKKKGSVVLSTYDPIRQEKTIVAKTSLEAKKPTQLSFIFKHPDMFRLDIPGKSPLYLVIDKGQNPVRVEMYQGKPVKIEGSGDSKKLLAYEAFRKESNKRLIRPTYKAMAEAGKRKDQEGEIAAVEAYVRNSQLHRKELIDFIQKEIGTSIALYWTSLRWTGDDQVDRLSNLVDAFTKKYPDLPMSKAMKDKVDRFKKVAIGTRAANLHGQTPGGKPITLYKSLGKYTLIDFWASWCRPCLLQIPDLKKVYADFHARGFEIFSYSIDTDGSKWLKAIETYAMPWKHASDIKGWQSEGAIAFNVTYVPFNFLVNEKGEIIAKNLHHKTLYKKLSQLFNLSSIEE